MSDRILNAAAVVFMICSVTGTAAFVWAEVGKGHTRAAPVATQRSIGQRWHAIAAQGHSHGATKPAVTLVEFVDYQCPVCRGFEGTIAELLRRHPDQLRVTVRQLPLNSIHPYADAAANAAECAAEQGRFDDYHHLLYQHQDSLGVLRWTVLAQRAGLPDTAAFGRCVAAQRYASAIAQDVAAARSLDLLGTPSVLINDILFAGARPLAELDSLVTGLATTHALERR
jgi:protein-disulfide isomerase